MFEIDNRVPGPIPSSKWYMVDTKKSLEKSIENTMNSACVIRAKINNIDTSKCPFPYILSFDTTSSVSVFLNTLSAMESIKIQTLDVYSPDGLQGKGIKK
jgi:hypothetical protein